MESSSMGNRSYKRIFAVCALALMLVLAGCVQGGGGGGNTSDTGTPSDTGTQNTDTDSNEDEKKSNKKLNITPKDIDTYKVEKLIANEINQYRKESGKNPLQFSQSLRVAARNLSDFVKKNAGEAKLARTKYAYIWGVNTTNYSVANKPLREILRLNGTILMGYNRLNPVQQQPFFDDAPSLLSRFKQFNALQCNKASYGNRWFGNEVFLGTLYGKAVSQKDEDIIVFSSGERLARGVAERFRNNELTSEIVTKTAYQYIGVGVQYNKNSGQVYVTVDVC